MGTTVQDFTTKSWDEARAQLFADLRRMATEIFSQQGYAFDTTGNLKLDAAVSGQLTPPNGGHGGMINLSDQASIPMDASEGSLFYIGALGNRTLQAPSNPTPGQMVTIAHSALGGSNRTLTLTTGASRAFRFNTTIPALTATVSATTDYIMACYNSVDMRWDLLTYIKG